MTDISVTGLEVTIIAIPTFPAGLKVTQFADDADPIDAPAINIAEYGMGVNGDLTTWRSPKPIVVNLAVIPGTEDDQNLQILYDANTVAKKKLSVKDKIQMIVRYADGTVKTLTNGAIVSGVPLDSGTSGGRIKSKVYGFVFENKIN